MLTLCENCGDEFFCRSLNGDGEGEEEPIETLCVDCRDDGILPDEEDAFEYIEDE